MSSKDGALVIATSELPDICTQNSTKNYQKGHKNEFFRGKRASGNSVVAFMVGVRRPLVPGYVLLNVVKENGNDLLLPLTRLPTVIL